jgi:hypothetical protein
MYSIATHHILCTQLVQTRLTIPTKQIKPVNDLHTQIFQLFHNVAFDRLPVPVEHHAVLPRHVAGLSAAPGDVPRKHGDVNQLNPRQAVSDSPEKLNNSVN